MSLNKKIRVMIVEDSAVVREFLEAIIGADPRLEVAASVSNAEDGLRLLRKVAPDVISLDIRLPGMDGFQATQRIMSDCPTPIVVVSASVEKEDLKVSINALKAGALAIVEKPLGLTHADYRQVAARLCTQLVLMSDVRLVRQRRRGSRTASPPSRSLAAHAAERFRMIGIVASTGGPSALERLLQGLPANFPLPILIVQHITPSFLEGFASWLADAAPLPVSVASEGAVPQAGHIYLAPADWHLRLRSGRLTLDQGAPISNQRPSGTALFESMALDLGPGALGALLTGMGADGALGLLALKSAGGYALAEDASTAVVYGMPQAAEQLGAVHEQLPIDAIAPRILELVGDQTLSREAALGMR